MLLLAGLREGSFGWAERDHGRCGRRVVVDCRQEWRCYLVVGAVGGWSAGEVLVGDGQAL